MPRTMGGFIIIAKDPTAKLIGIMRPLRLGDTWLHSRAGLPVDTLTFVIAHVCIRLARSRNRHVLHSLRLFFSYLSFKKHGNSLLTHSHDNHSFILFLERNCARNFLCSGILSYPVLSRQIFLGKAIKT